MTKLQQTVKEQKKGSWKALSAGGRRGGGWAAPLILHHKHHSIFSCFFFFVFFKPGKTKGLRNVLERHSVDFALSKARSLCFLSGTLTDAGCPSAPGYVYPEVEQAQQALHRLHLWHASSGEPLFFHARRFFYLLNSWCCCDSCCLIPVRRKTKSPVLLSVSFTSLAGCCRPMAGSCESLSPQSCPIITGMLQEMPK